MELNLLIRRPWDGEIILDYWGDPGVVTRVFMEVEEGGRRGASDVMLKARLE